MTDYFAISVKCPHCGKSFMDDGHHLHGKHSIKLDVKEGGRQGTVHLCSLYGCYDHECSIELVNLSVPEFSCPHCRQALTSKETCPECDAPMVSLQMEVGGRVSICSRKGCKKHYVAFENIEDEMQKFYDEFGS